MPKYRVSTDNGEQLDDGNEGLEFANDKAASDEAQRAIADMAQERLPDGMHRHMKVSVRNEADEVVYQAPLTFRGETAEDMKSQAAKAARKSMN